MKRQLIILSTIALGVSACEMFDPERKHNTSNAPRGEYEQTLTSTDVAGTKTVKKVSSAVKTDSSGNKKTVVKSKVTEDPKGLMNKTTLSKTEDVVEEEDGKTSVTHEHEENESSEY